MLPLFYDVPLVNALFLGVKATVVLIVVEALLRVARKALSETAHWIIAALAFIGIFFLALPFPLIIAAAAAFGFVFSRSEPPNGPKAKIGAAGSVGRTLSTIAVWLSIWIVPLALVGFLVPSPVLGMVAARSETSLCAST